MTAVETNEKLKDETKAGNYFVSNYPPFSFWSPEKRTDALSAFDQPPRPDTPLGLYLHIPFCRKRCHFCYFKVYTDKPSQEVRDYLDAAMRELEDLSKRACIGGRKPRFIYFGGGTPSYLSTRQLRELTDRMKELLPWDEVEEVTFECEPGTLTESKLKVLREIGVTRLSLGVENFDEHILEINGRAHLGKEIHRAYGFAKEVGFPQINIDLIAGMLEETPENWQACIEKTIEMEPDSITIYQMEIPFNTTIYQRMREAGKLIAPVADWETKRDWVAQAFARLEQEGYHIASAYTAVRNKNKTSFVYRDQLWRGADLLAVGVSSFGHISGTHYQNRHRLHEYKADVDAGKLPVYRALTPTARELLTRETILQFKLGYLEPAYFQKVYGEDIREVYKVAFDAIRQEGMLAEDTPERISLTRDGLLQVDRLLHYFFLPEHRNVRYA